MSVARKRGSDKGDRALRERRPDLLEWYDRNRRDLPWRRDVAADPERRAWEIWLSEVMAQQTRVEVAAPYWERFRRRYPEPRALAAAPEEEVLAAWSGLGYYRRARMLRRAAEAVVERGSIPRTAAALEELPGVGPYTAAAVASIAFGEVVAVVDGNVERVLGRVLALEDDPGRSVGRRAVRAGAEALLDPGRPGDSNQAMMELGALVCRPRSPQCGACPLAAVCRARAQGRPEELPRRGARRATERSERWVAVVEDGEGRLLLARRSADEELLAGFWELPWGAAEDGGKAAAEEALGRRYGGRFRLAEEAGRVRHTITHRLITLRLHRARWEPEEVAEAAAEAALRWWDPKDREVPVGAATRKCVAAFRAVSS